MTANLGQKETSMIWYSDICQVLNWVTVNSLNSEEAKMSSFEKRNQLGIGRGRIWIQVFTTLGFPVGSVVKNPPANAGDRVWSLNQKDPLKKEMAAHSSVLAWESPWTDEPGRLQSLGSQSRHNWECTHAPLSCDDRCTAPLRICTDSLFQVPKGLMDKRKHLAISWLFWLNDAKQATSEYFPSLIDQLFET